MDSVRFNRGSSVTSYISLSFSALSFKNATDDAIL